MLSKKDFIIVGLTTFNREFLRISIPAIAKLRQNIFLIIHNDNPDVLITKKEIAALGYRGSVHLINNTQNDGLLQARLNILSVIPELKIRSEWMIFVNDDDFLIDIDVPLVGQNNFAIMQNMVVVKKRLLDLLKIMENPRNYTVDNIHVVMERPHVGTAGTLLRTDIMVSFGKIIGQITDQIHEIDAKLITRPPHDLVMWLYLQIYAKYLDQTAEPIYMDKTNYIAIKLDTAAQKYGKNVLSHDKLSKYYEKNIQKYCDLFQKILTVALIGL